MAPDKRIVPENQIVYLLEEEHIPERTKTIRHRLIKSPKKIDKVAEHWIENSGVNTMARVMLNNVDKIPRTESHHQQNIIDHQLSNTHHSVSHDITPIPEHRTQHSHSV